MNCFDYKIKPCSTCSEEYIAELCWVEFFVRQLKHCNIKDYILICKGTAYINNAPAFNMQDHYPYLRVAVEHHYPEHLNAYDKLMILL